MTCSITFVTCIFFYIKDMCRVIKQKKTWLCTFVCVDCESKPYCMNPVWFFLKKLRSFTRKLNMYSQKNAMNSSYLRLFLLCCSNALLLKLTCWLIVSIFIWRWPICSAFFFISIKELVFSNLFVLLIKTCSTLAISLKKTLLIPLSVIPPASAKSIKIYGLFYLLMPNLIQKFYCTSDHCTWIFQAKPCCI